MKAKQLKLLISVGVLLLIAAGLKLWAQHWG
jgi:hypothetical protein